MLRRGSSREAASTTGDPTPTPLNTVLITADRVIAGPADRAGHACQGRSTSLCEELLAPVSKSGVSLWQDRGMLRLTDFIVDCPDTMKLAAFYSEVTGRPIKEGSSEDWAGIQFGEIELAFIRVDDYRAPQWPDSEHPKQFHLDFEVDEIESEQRRVLDLGATLRQDFIGPNGYGWRIYTDPIGHPFCLCRNKGVIWTDQGPIWPKRA